MMIQLSAKNPDLPARSSSGGGVSSVALRSAPLRTIRSAVKFRTPLACQTCVRDARSLV